MVNKVFIKDTIFMKDNFDYVNVTDKNIDTIGIMCIAAIQKLRDGFDEIKMDVPVFFGSAYSSLESLHEFNKVCEKSGALQVNPSLFPNTVLNSPACRAGIFHHITSPIYNISNGLASAETALELAYMYISNGDIDNAIVCFAEQKSSLSEKIERHEIRNRCGVIYLSSHRSKFEISDIRRKQNNSMLSRMSGNKELFEIINNFCTKSINHKVKSKQIFDGYETKIQIEYRGKS